MSALLPRSIATPPPVSGARWIPLTQDKWALVDVADFAWLSKFNWCACQKGSCWYACRDGKTNQKPWRVYMHHAVFGHRVPLDHKDGNGLNNRSKNLRPATQAQNVQNQGLSSRNKSGFKGVCWHPLTRKWRATVGARATYSHLGLFDNPVEAAKAYNAAATKLFGRFARLNQIGRPR